MQVLRVESFASCCGPYFGSPINLRTGASSTHPLPGEDNSLRDEWMAMSWDDQQSWFFAFKDAAQLDKWFDSSDREAFSAYNSEKGARDDWYGIATYEVPAGEVMIGDSQAVFRKELATRVEFDFFHPAVAV